MTPYRERLHALAKQAKAEAKTTTAAASKPTTTKPKRNAKPKSETTVFKPTPPK